MLSLPEKGGFSSKKKKELPMLSLKFLRVSRLLIISLLCVGYNRALLHSLSVRVR